MSFIFFLFSFYLFSSHNRFATYIDISFIQSANISGGAFFSGGEVRGNLSTSYDINDRKSFYFSYIIDYQGPGSFTPERDLKERIISNSFIAEYHYLVENGMRIRPQIFIGMQKFRDSVISSYRDGLYNNNITGAGVSVDFLKIYYLTFFLNYRKIGYPNYTDLLSEMKYDNNMIKTGMYDKNVYEAGFRLKREKIFFEFNFEKYSYSNQNVISQDGTLSGEKQKDFRNVLSFGYSERLKGLDFFPVLSITFYSSNQNYLRYKNFTDTTPYFVKDAYSKRDVDVSLPVSFENKNYSFNGGININYRSYLSRPPRDEYNNYIEGKKQNQIIYRFFLDLSRKITTIAYWKIGYSFALSRSNNKFEYYIPYNYSAHSFFLEYGIRY